MLMREKLEICPVWGKLQIKFPLRTKETEAIMVLFVEFHKVFVYIESSINSFVWG